jgi:hypothetical protein
MFATAVGGGTPIHVLNWMEYSGAGGVPHSRTLAGISAGGTVIPIVGGVIQVLRLVG